MTDTTTEISGLTVATSAAASDDLILNVDSGSGTYTTKRITFANLRTSLLASSAVTSLAGTANEITASASTGAVTLSLPSALTFTGKTITGGTFSSPTLTTPALGTPSAGVLTSCTGLPISTGVSGLGTGIATALAVNTGSAGAPVLFNGAGGTPSSLTGTNITGTAAGLSIGGNAATATSATTATSASTATTATNIAGGAAGQIPRQTGAGATGFTTATYPATAGTSGNVLTSDGTNWTSSALAVTVPYGHMNGLTLSVAGSTATFGVAAGQAADSTNAALMSLGSAYTKTMGGTWAVGTGQHALDAGTVANNTWYHIWLIQRSDTGVVDILASTSATGPTMPTNYDRKRRIGSMKTNGSAQWIKFIQDGDRFDWDTPIFDASGAAPAGTTAVSQTVSVPTGVSVQALMDIALIYYLGNLYAFFSPLDTADIAASSSYYGATATDQYNNVHAIIRTNTSAQIRARFSATTGLYTIRTTGWIDARGKN